VNISRAFPSDMTKALSHHITYITAAVSSENRNLSKGAFTYSQPSTTFNTVAIVKGVDSLRDIGKYIVLTSGRVQVLSSAWRDLQTHLRDNILFWPSSNNLGV